MFIGIVLAITIASISILSVVNVYYVSFIDNFWDLNEYYSSKYAAISAIERGLNTRKNDGNFYWEIEVTWSSAQQKIRTWYWKTSSWTTLSGTNTTWAVWNFINWINF